MKPKLVKPSDRELDEAVAQYVAGWRRVHGEWRSPQKSDAIERTGICTDELEYPPFYSTRADAVLPLLSVWRWETNWHPSYKTFLIVLKPSIQHPKETTAVNSEAETFPRAACIALLRTHGVEVET